MRRPGPPGLVSIGIFTAGRSRRYGFGQERENGTSTYATGSVVSHSWDFTPLRSEARYGDRIVQCFPERLPCLGAFVARWLAERPDDEAFVYRDDRVTWREADRRIGILTAALAGRGLAAGDRM